MARIVVPGFPHHVTQRGNRQANVFETDSDRQTYLRFLETHCAKRGLSVWAYCLMTNHVHLVVVPKDETALSVALRDAHTNYAVYFNSRRDQSGHLWQGRFFSCPLDKSHRWAAVRYVEQSPVRAGMTGRAEDYPWSSAAAHCGRRNDSVLSAEFPPPGVIEDWSEWLNAGREAVNANAYIRTQTKTGRHCGSSDFVDELEERLGRSLRPKKRGRPSKKGN